MYDVGQIVTVYSDKPTKKVTPESMVKQVKINKKRIMEAIIPVNGAFLIAE